MAGLPASPTFGSAHATRTRLAPALALDLLVIAGVGGLLFGARDFAGHWTAELRPTIEIDLSPAALPLYAFYSLSRGVLAYFLSLGFTLAYGYWAAKDHRAERVLVPLLDVLQSIPVLGFMPGFVLALVGLFPRSNMGLELAAVLMIFTGQAWNMTFSFYHSLRSVPPEQREVARLYRFGAWRTLWRVELPFATTGLVYNSMMSMAGGWFFLMVSEAFVLGDKDFRLPGLGAYMSVAAARSDHRAMFAGVLAMVVMIALLDQIVWRPLVVWAQRFRIEDAAGEVQATSWFYDLLHASPTVHAIRRALRRARAELDPKAALVAAPPKAAGRGSALASPILFVALVGLLVFGGVRVVRVLERAPPAVWIASAKGSGLTLARVLTSTMLATLWTVPAGLWIGLSPRVARVLQPVVQIAASFPAPMLFPAVVAVLHGLGVGLGAGSIVLMLLGTQWYVLFNVVAGAAAIPADLREVATSYRFSRAQRFKKVYLPAVFPFLVTGWVTAAGGAWNASIVSEYVSFRGETLTTTGLGAEISRAAEHADFPSLAASVVVMSIVVVLFNRTVWRYCYGVAERRFALAK